MFYLIFIVTSGIVSLTSLFFSFKKDLWKRGRFLLPLLSFALFFMSLFAYFASKEIDVFIKEIWIKGTISFFVLWGFFLLEITADFLGKDGINPLFHIAKKRVELRYLWRSGCAFLVVISLFCRWLTFYLQEGNFVFVVQKITADFLLSGLFFCYLLNLYLLEKIFRNTSIIQKRSFISFIIASGIITLLAIIGIVRTLYYRTFTIEMLKFYTIIGELSFIAIFISVLRYKMWEEKIEVGRGMIYTSLTVLFFGAFLLLLGCLAILTKYIGVHFRQFESFAIIFTIVGVGAFLIFSPNMRKTITQISLKYIYKSKYDYRDQFIRLHNIYKESGDLVKTIRAFIDNLCYTLMIKDAKVFVYDEIKNYFYMIEEFPTIKGQVFIPKKSKIIEIFETQMIKYIEVIDIRDKNENKVIEDEYLHIDINEIDLPFRNLFTHFFSIRYKNQLMGVLALDKGDKIFDSEDIMIIEILCDSIGAAIYRDKIERERIEKKQLESFTHTASIIVHEIKDQVGVLSTIAENAKTNIDNKEYHPILINSLVNCAARLTLLIEKLKKPPQAEMLKREEINCNDIIINVIRQIKPALKDDIILKEDLGEIDLVFGDTEALSYVIKNLIINSIEAIRGANRKGTITCSTYSLKILSPEDTFSSMLNISDTEKYSVCITVKDDGPGIKKEFLEEKLFRPFNTTKEKGIGLGLYQCKILIEGMGGRIFCKSEENKGTTFFITL